MKVMNRCYWGFLMSICFSACSRTIPFSAERWLEKDDIGGYVWRAEMVDDLRSAHKLIGLRPSEVASLLGPPDFVEGNDQLWTISVDFGPDIDPIQQTYLVLQRGADSLVVDHNLREVDH
jgi:hypothetical protein